MPKRTAGGEREHGSGCILTGAVATGPLRRMRLLIEELDEAGHAITSRVVEHRDGTVFRIGPEGCHHVVPRLQRALAVYRRSSGRVMLDFAGHERELTFAQSVDFSTDGVWLRLSLLAGDVGGRGLCPRCGGALRESLGGGAYRSVARTIRSCAACGAQILELAEAATTLGSFVDATSTDFFTVVTPRRCPGCDNPLKRSRLRTAKGESEVERCIRCDLLVLERPDLDLLVGRD